MSNITGTFIGYSGGGGGGSVTGPPGGVYPNTGGTPGSGNSSAATRGGGSGGGGLSSGNGGAGLVIIRYPDTMPPLTNISPGLVYNEPVVSGFRVYRFTGGTGTVTYQ
jgi:hypothetical protein